MVKEFVDCEAEEVPLVLLNGIKKPLILDKVLESGSHDSLGQAEVYLKGKEEVYLELV